ncbi:protein kinase domain-containing protein [Nonomuraea rhizosphaerae]|uniref:protein kinase domain-containing protein n=1 Tax=Nonomuraea rhizosphaerae TaxID=2665663 RepID=UPI001C5CCBCE|nr:serine/threonine-protein kinase [Nonomuraea rhizosphaerae]
MNDDRLGPYRLLRRLGEGGMGVVHLAVDPQGRQVAVKVLRSEVAGDEVARRRLSREVETMRRVRSKYIAEVVDADVTGHRPYIVTRYVPGRPLDEIIKDDGPLDLPALVRIAHGVATALSAVHAGGVIHRDLKPGNVLILDGDPVLIDFGIAQAVDATRLTQTGMFIGTPGYLAPEIIEGQEAGPEVDIHAWAGTLLYAGTGQPPFGKGTLEMIFYNITAGKADVSAAPAELQPLLKAAFQRNPAKRPKAAELAEQTARMLPKPPGHVPDEISTIPRSDRSGPSLELPTPPPIADKPPYDVSTPPMTPRSLIDNQLRQNQEQGRLGSQQGPARSPLPQSGPQSGPQSAVQGQSGPQSAAQGQSGPQPPHAGQSGPQAPHGGGQGGGQGGPQPPHVSLLPEQQGGDPWPTRRVTPDELRRMQREGAAQPWQVPAQGSGQPSQGSLLPPHTPSHNPPHTPSHTPSHTEGDVPTRRVRPDPPDAPTRRVRPDAPDYGRGTPVQPPPYIPVQGQFAHDAQTRRDPYANPQTRRDPYQPEPQHDQYGQGDLRTKREPFVPGARPGQVTQRSKAYGLASAMLLILMIVAAVMAPVLVALVAVPFVVLLRAADMAQPELTGRRSTGTAALDVVRVLAFPAALAKSVGITFALGFYALILGLPVTLLLAVVVKMNAYNALAWGASIALWTVCAGPGVEGPGRQMRRTLSSLVPSRTAAMVMVGVLAAGAALSLILAYGTFGSNARRAVWTPLDVGPLVSQLDGLKGNSGN